MPVPSHRHLVLLAAYCVHPRVGFTTAVEESGTTETNTAVFFYFGRNHRGLTTTKQQKKHSADSYTSEYVGFYLFKPHLPTRGPEGTTSWEELHVWETEFHQFCAVKVL